MHFLYFELEILDFKLKLILITFKNNVISHLN